MPILNETLTFASLPDGVQNAFTGGRAMRERLDAGTLLYKFTDHPLAGHDGRITPWWSSVKPLAANDPGLNGTLARAGRVGADPRDFVRARSAVTQQWNGLGGVIRARLMCAVYGFVGRCAAQRIDETQFSNVVFIGGGYQLYIPNLTTTQIMTA